MSFLSKIGVTEDDAAPQTKKPAPHAAAPAPAFNPQPSYAPQPNYGGPSPTPGYTPPPMPGGYQPQPVMTPELQAKMTALESIVYASPSSYVVFRNFHAQPQMANMDPATVLNLLGAANQSVTLPKVLADIDTHLGILTTERQKFDAAVESKKQQTIDAPQQQIEHIQQLNAQAMQEIQQRNEQATALQQGIVAAQQSLNDSVNGFVMIESMLEQPLNQAKQLLSAIPHPDTN